MTATIISAVAAGAALITAAIALVTALRQAKKAQSDEGQNRGALASDVGYIKAGVDDLKRENRENRVAVRDVSERVTRCEESCKQAHRRIDELKK